MKKIYTVKEVAELLGFSTNTVYKYLDEGKIKGERLAKEGRFRIPAEELSKFLPADESSPVCQPKEDFSPVGLLPNKIDTPSLFDWLVVILAIGIGLSQFVFPNYQIGEVSARLLKFIKIAKFALFASGVFSLFSGIFFNRKNFGHKIAHFFLAVLFATLSVLDFLTGSYFQFVIYLILSCLLIINAAVRCCEYLKFLILINVLAFSLGLIAFLKPFNVLTGVIVASGFWGVAAWLIFSALLLFVSIIAFKRRGRLALVLAFAIAFLGFLVAGVAFSYGFWEVAIFNSITAAFAIIFPHSDKFASFALKSKTVFINSFFWLTALFLTGAMILLLIYRSFENYLLTEIGRRLETAKTVTTTFISQNENRLSVFAANASLPALFNLARPNNSELSQILKEFYQASSGSFRRLIAVDKTGNIIDLYPYVEASIGINVADTDYFKANKKGQKLFTTGIIQPKASGVPPALLVSAPVLSESGEFLGILVGSSDLDYLSDRLREVKFGEDGVFAVVDREGRYIIAPQKELILTTAPEGSAAMKAVKGERSQNKVYNSKGILSLAAYSDIKALGWGIVAEQPFVSVFRAYSLLGYLIFLVIVMSGVGSLIYAINSRKN